MQRVGRAAECGGQVLGGEHELQAELEARVPSSQALRARFASSQTAAPRAPASVRDGQHSGGLAHDQHANIGEAVAGVRDAPDRDRCPLSVKRQGPFKGGPRLPSRDYAFLRMARSSSWG